MTSGMMSIVHRIHGVLIWIRVGAMMYYWSIRQIYQTSMMVGMYMMSMSIDSRPETYIRRRLRRRNCCYWDVD